MCTKFYNKLNGYLPCGHHKMHPVAKKESEQTKTNIDAFNNDTV